MTKIKKIVMHGFKSFALKTEIPFGTGFNVILGPNGSGKSNVLDALTFVLGKGSAKGLRAEKAANLIYNGGKTKTPSKEGKVSIFFDNTNKVFPTDDQEVKVTRIVKQSGQSVYKINDKTRTRQQVLDLLSIAKINPDASNIVLQGDITRFVEMSHVQRREIVEEIAGISVYEEKKHKAMLELDKVEQKLSDAEIVLKEREVHLRELKKDRDQALKFKNLEDKIDQNKASLLKRQIDEKQIRNDSYESDITKHREKIKKIQDEIDSLKKIVENKKEELKKLNEEVEKRGEKEQIDLHKEVEQLKINFAVNKTKIGNLEDEITKVETRKDQLQKNLAELNEKISNLGNEKIDLNKEIEKWTKELDSISSKIQEFRKDRNIDKAGDVEKEIDEIDKEADEKEKEIGILREQQQNILREKDKLELQIQTVDEKIEKVIGIGKEHKEELDELKERKEKLKDTILKLTDLQKENISLVAQIENARLKLKDTREDLERLETKNVGIREKLTGGIAVQKILENKDKFGKIYGTVAELGNVDSKYALALETAAGLRIKSLVVENDEIAANCIKYLKSNRLGVATFLPLNKIKPKPIKEEKRFTKEDGVEDFAINLVSFDEKFKKVFSYVFGSTLVVSDIDVIRKIGVGSVRMVTLDGDLAEVSGAIHGGFRQKKGISFQEKELTSEINEHKKKVSDAENVVITLEKRKLLDDKEIDELSKRKSTLEGEIIKSEKSLYLESGDIGISKKVKLEFEEQLKETDKELDDIGTKIATINAVLTEMKEKKQGLRSRVSQLRQPAMLAELNAFEQKRDQLNEEISNVKGEMKNIETQINDILDPERENIQKILNQLDTEKKKSMEEIEQVTEKIAEQQIFLKEKEKEEMKFYSRFKELFTKRNKLNEEVQEQETKIIAREEQIRGIDQKINDVSIGNAKVIAELTALKEEFKRYENIQLSNKSEQELRNEISQFERLVSDIGSVNLRALEVYESVEKEYKKMLEKKEILGSEKNDVMVMMNEIDSKKKETFIQTLEGLKDNFARIFSALTAKGKVHLELENPEKPFEEGLAIKVRITGNRFLDIRSLSGGEKTLTALAFIFAIQEYEPASFYILDEVDAALDKRNSEKFADLIKKYSEKAQYIIISHNDGVISLAENLYGFSMDEHGISKVVSLKI